MIKIGFFGATANGPYNFAKQVHQNGHKKIIFIIDRDMKRVQQHPLWSDKKTLITYNEFNNSQNWTYDRWIKWEKKNKWIKPTWVKSYVIKNRDGYFHNNYEKIIFELNKCDILFLNGTNILNKSHKLNKPYIIWPHGSDIRVTANIEKIDLNGIKNRVNYFFFRSRLKKGFKRAKLIGSHTPILKTFWRKRNYCHGFHSFNYCSVCPCDGSRRQASCFCWQVYGHRCSFHSRSPCHTWTRSKSVT